MLNARFCLRCGTPLESQKVDDRLRPVCPRCGYIHYVNPIVAAGTLVDHHGRVLLVRRGAPPGEGQWGLPAGYAEAGERPEETAVRETLEETGVRVALDDLLDVYAFSEEDSPGGVLILYAAHIEQGEPVAGDDATEARFFAPDALPRQIAFATHRQALTQWARVRTVTYGEATPAEIEAALRLIQDAGLTEETSWGRYSLPETETTVRQKSAGMIVAREGITAEGRVGRGVIGVCRYSHHGIHGVHIHDLYVRPEYRRWGVGGRLLARTEQMARSRGAVMLMTRVSANDPGMAFYLRNGFAVCGYESDQAPGHARLCRRLPSGG